MKNINFILFILIVGLCCKSIVPIPKKTNFKYAFETDSTINYNYEKRKGAFYFSIYSPYYKQFRFRSLFLDSNGRVVSYTGGDKNSKEINDNFQCTVNKLAAQDIEKNNGYYRKLGYYQITNDTVINMHLIECYSENLTCLNHFLTGKYYRDSIKIELWVEKSKKAKKINRIIETNTMYYFKYFP